MTPPRSISLSFDGPPGTGKSSLIRALASEINLDIASLDIGRATLTDDDLREAIVGAPARSLIAIEDVDAVFTQTDSGGKLTGISFSGLLNASTVMLHGKGVR